jgi:hypothetical protein
MKFSFSTGANNIPGGQFVGYFRQYPAEYQWVQWSRDSYDKLQNIYNLHGYLRTQFWIQFYKFLLIQPKMTTKFQYL